jgi:hypothetical protein
MSAGLFAMIYVYELYLKHGIPKFSSEYGAAIIPDPATMKVFLGGLLVMSYRPYIFAIAPIFLTELTNFTPDLFQFLRSKQEMIEAQVMPMLGE